MKNKKILLFSSMAFLLTMSLSSCGEKTPSTYKIDWETLIGYEFLSANNKELPEEVKANEEVYFLLKVEEGYDTSFEVKANTETLTPVNGVYSFVVTADTKVTIDGFQKLSFNINTNVIDGVSLILDDNSKRPLPEKVEYGTELKFKANVKVGFIGEPKITVNGNPLEKSPEGNYSIIVTSDLDIKVSGVYKEMTGDGTLNNPYVVYNKHNLFDFAKNYNSESGESATKYLSLANDIDLGNEEWTPIGTTARPFTGFIEGNGHTINNLKITKYDLTKSFGYGLIGVGFDVVINDLTVKGNIEINDILPESVDHALYAGLVGGMIQGLSFENVRSEGNVKVSTKYAPQVACGGLIGAFSGVTNYAYRLFGAQFKGSVEASGKSDFAGGIIGLQTGSASILSMQNVEVDASLIKAGYGVAGVTPQLPFMDSISFSSVKVDKLEQTGEAGYIGGIAGVAVTETAILNNIVEIGNLVKKVDKAGYVVGVKSEDQFANNYDEYGTALFKNYVLTNDKEATEENGTLIKKEQVNEQLIEEIGLSKQVFNIKTGELPTLLDEISYGKNIELTVHNLTKDDKVAVPDSVFSPIDYKPLVEKQSGKLAAGLYYDKEGKYSYRSYVPITGETPELYLVYTDFSKISGIYTGYCSMSTEEQAVTKNLTLEFFEDGTASFVNQDFETIKYDYWTDGSNFFIENEWIDYTFHYENGTFSFFDKSTSDENYYYHFKKAGNDFYGYYELSNNSIIIIRNDKTLLFDGIEVNYVANETGFDFETPSCSYKVKKVGQGFEVTWNDYEYEGTLEAKYLGHYPDYQKDPFINKTYYLGLNVEHNDELVFLPNGNIKTKHYYAGTSSYGENSGSFRKLTTSEIKICSHYFNADAMKYDKNKDLFYGLNKGNTPFIISSKKTIGKYFTDDGLSIFLTEGGTHVLRSKTLESSAKIEGEFKEGNTVAITISGTRKEYKVVGEKLIVLENVDKTPVALTYEGELEGKKYELVLLKDGSGTLNGEALKYTFDSKNVEFVVGTSTYKLVFDSNKKTLIGTVESGGTSKNISFNQKVVVKEIYGKWECESLGGKSILEIKNDGTVLMDGNAVTNVKLTAKSLTFEFNYETYSFKYDSSKDKMTGSFTYDYEEIPYQNIVRLA